jgi:hypothetical protein
MSDQSRPKCLQFKYKDGETSVHYQFQTSADGGVTWSDHSCPIYGFQEMGALNVLLESFAERGSVQAPMEVNSVSWDHKDQALGVSITWDSDAITKPVKAVFWCNMGDLTADDGVVQLNGQRFWTFEEREAVNRLVESLAPLARKSMDSASKAMDFGPLFKGVAIAA